MIANAMFVATLIFLALGFGLMSQMHFLVPLAQPDRACVLATNCHILRAAVRQSPRSDHLG